MWWGVMQMRREALCLEGSRFGAFAKSPARFFQARVQPENVKAGGSRERLQREAFDPPSRWLKALTLA
jgi:hypothetical protein